MLFAKVKPVFFFFFVLFQDMMVICNTYFPEIYNLITHESE